MTAVHPAKPCRAVAAGRRPATAAVLAASLVFAAIALADAPATRPAGLTVGGEVEHGFTLSVDELKAMPRQTLHVKDHDGHPATYEGVLVRDILLKAGLPLGNHRLKGKATGLSVITASLDGYHVAFGLAEFDDDYAERQIVLADTRDGHALDAKEGPLRLVVPQEARQGRWARQVTGLTVVAPPGP